MDITYIPMERGFVYLAVVLDWATRRVLSWRLSITMEAAFCVETLEDALARHGKPEVFNADQGSQLTGAAFTRPAHQESHGQAYGKIERPSLLCNSSNSSWCQWTLQCYSVAGISSPNPPNVW